MKKNIPAYIWSFGNDTIQIKGNIDSLLRAMDKSGLKYDLFVDEVNIKFIPNEDNHDFAKNDDLIRILRILIEIGVYFAQDIRQTYDPAFAAYYINKYGKELGRFEVIKIMNNGDYEIEDCDSYSERVSKYEN